MASHSRATPGRVDADGVRCVETSTAGKIVRLTLLAMGAVVLAVVGALVGLRVSAARRVDPEAPRPDALAAAPRAGSAPYVVPPPAAPVVAAADPSSPPPRAPAPAPHAVPRAPAAAAEPPEKEDAPFTIGDPKERTGMRVFPPMGTKPIKRGIVVPDDFELPPGYVRHYQATDDGERLPAILMFSPDYEWVDGAGKPLVLPPDRVVPPEMAPPGLPVELLEVPQPKAPPDGRP